MKYGFRLHAGGMKKCFAADCAVVARFERSAIKRYARPHGQLSAGARYACRLARGEMAPSSRLALCMIVRDSSRTLRACLSSVVPWVDELIVVDTGSLDDTRQIAAEFHARVVEFPWCDDFAAARNESLRHAAAPWLFWMDSDDTIDAENGLKLRELANGPLETGPTAYVMQVHCPGPAGSAECTVVDHVKMFRNDPRLRFEGRIHEQILPAIRRIDGSVEWTDIFVAHSGVEHTLEAKRRKQERDLRLLEMELAERPEHPFVLFNLGMTYADMEQSEPAVRYLKRCLLASSIAESHVRKAYALLVGSLIQLGQDVEARQILGRGRELYPDDPELFFRLGILEHRTKNYAAAIEAYRGALHDQTERYFSSRDDGISGYKTRHNLAGIYREIGRLDLAELQWRLALEAEPMYWEGWHGLVESLLDQKRYAALEVEIESAQQAGVPQQQIVCAAAQLAAKRGNIEAAIQMLDEASAHLRGPIELLRLKCQLTFEHSTAEQAIAALEELCRKTPDDGAAWHNLGTAYQRSGCNALAEISYQKSLALRPDSIPTLRQLVDVQKAMGRHDAARGWSEVVNRTKDVHPAMPDVLDTLQGSPIAVAAG